MVLTCQKSHYLGVSLANIFLHHVVDMAVNMSPTCQLRHVMSVILDLRPTCQNPTFPAKRRRDTWVAGVGACISNGTFRL